MAGIVEDWRIADFGPNAVSLAALNELLAFGNGDTFVQNAFDRRDDSGGAVGPQGFEDLAKGFANGLHRFVLGNLGSCGVEADNIARAVEDHNPLFGEPEDGFPPLATGIHVVVEAGVLDQNG